ncbi:MAG: A/G-specific adenine glycosylase [Pseudomonadota bacterium]
MTGQAQDRKAGFSTALLDWYDVHARDLPWRVGPKARAKGERPDPYRVWLSEVMLQQTTVATVTPRYEAFLAKWPTVKALAAAPLEEVLGEWAGLGYYARARNLHACAVVVATEHGGIFPDTEEGLLTLPGIGPYTAAAIAAIAFDRSAVVVDGNVDRVMVRLHRIDRPIRDAKADIREAASALTPGTRAGDYAQALMDLGATVCRPKGADCLLCPVTAFCEARKAGVQDALPVKPPKKARPTRYGVVYVGRRTDGAILTERRPSKGLFGGMAGLPGGDWSEGEAPKATPPVKAPWQETGQAEHTLTHFHLILTVMTGEVKRAPKGMFWTAVDDLETLPTVFRKAVKAALT